MIACTFVTCCSINTQYSILRVNEVNPRRAQVSTGMGDPFRAGIPSQYVTRQLGQLSLASPRGR